MVLLFCTERVVFFYEETETIVVDVVLALDVQYYDLFLSQIFGAVLCGVDVVLVVCD